MSPSRVFLSLGGNLGDPGASMGEALRLLDRDPHSEVKAVSSLYRTPPWGKLDQPDFLNAAAEIGTTRTPRDFLDLCLAVERSLKRERGERWGPRLIDLDLLLFGDLKVDDPGLEIPHPRMADRAFVLVPLEEIAPDVVIESAPISDHLAKLDRSGIVRVEGSKDWWRTA